MAAPWRRMSDQHILRVDIPHLGVDGACISIIGAAGESFGLALFAGDLSQRPVTGKDIRILTAVTRAFLAFFARHRDLFDHDDPEPVRETSEGEDGVNVTITAPYVVFRDDPREPALSRRDRERTAGDAPQRSAGVPAGAPRRLPREMDVYCTAFPAFTKPWP